MMAQTLVHALNFTHNTPCATTLHTVLRHVDHMGLTLARVAVDDKTSACVPTTGRAFLLRSK